MTLRRTSILVLLLVYLAAAGAWILHVPYRPDQLMRPIPPSAAYVGVHEEFDKRWDDIAGSSILQDLLVLGGVPPEEVGRVVNDPDLLTWMPRLAGRKTVLAYVPEYGPLRMEAWVVTSWIGRYSRFARWYDGLGLLKDAERRTSSLGTQMFELVEPLGAGPEAFTFALEDGVLIGCWTAHPGGVSYLQRSARSRDGRPWTRLSALQASDTPDRGLLYPSRVVDNPVLTRPIRVGLKDVDPDRISFSVAGEERIPVEESDTVSDLQLDDMSRILGALPDAVIGAPTTLIAAMLPSRDRRIFEIVTRDAMTQMAGTRLGLPVVAALLSDDYSGRIGRGNAYFLFQGVKVPTLLIAVPHHDAHRAQAAAGLMLDRVNGLFQARLIPRRAEVGDRSMTIIEGTSGDFYSELDIKERVAYAICDRWIVLCSNSDALRKLLARYDRGEAMRFSPDERWRQGIAGGDSSLYAWIDVPQVVGSIKAGLTLAKFLLPRDEKGAGTQWHFAQALDAVNLLAALDAVEGRLETHSEGWRADVSMEGRRRDTP